MLGGNSLIQTGVDSLKKVGGMLRDTVKGGNSLLNGNGLIQTGFTKVFDIVNGTVGSLIPELDGLWFYDDDGKLVKVSPEIPNLMDFPIDVTQQVTFTLYTRRNLVGEPLILNSPHNLSSSTFDLRKPTFLVTHGWTNSKRSPACQTVKDGKQ